MHFIRAAALNLHRYIILIPERPSAILRAAFFTPTGRWLFRRKDQHLGGGLPLEPLLHGLMRAKRNN